MPADDVALWFGILSSRSLQDVSPSSNIASHFFRISEMSSSQLDLLSGNTMGSSHQHCSPIDLRFKHVVCAGRVRSWPPVDLRFKHVVCADWVCSGPPVTEWVMHALWVSLSKSSSDTNPNAVVYCSLTQQFGALTRRCSQRCPFARVDTVSLSYLSRVNVLCTWCAGRCLIHHSVMLFLCASANNRIASMSPSARREDQLGLRLNINERNGKYESRRGTISVARTNNINKKVQ
jgi:hypothetical protein